MTKFEQTPVGLFYTPSAHLGIALSLLLVARIASRFIVSSFAALPTGGPGAGLVQSPLTLMIFGTMAGYYITYAIGLLRWHSRVSQAAQSPEIS